MTKKKATTYKWDEFFRRLKNSIFRPKRQTKDIVFRLVFGNDRQALLQLYNVLHGTAYADPHELQIVTLDNAIYISRKNDLAFLLAGSINMYEHQSTLNPNMPVRFLIYLAQEYQLLVESTDKSLYGSELIPLPTPQCIVFYNGTTDTPDEYELRLSSAFSNQDVEPAVEVMVKVININYGHNEHLMQGCGMLSQYAQFVAVTREYANKYDNREEAMNAAIEYCIGHGILEDILRKHRSQVLGSLLEEFDEKKYARTLREEGYEAGRTDGYESGRTDGFSEGERCGLERGIEQGAERGRMEKEQELLQNLMYTMNITEAEAREKLGI
ncbi:MAG: hypothetical protein PUD03_03125 [Lachnospiraceae bacterium]|nr:hypothetical protein [Lachnospiraceae bacterium]